MGLSNEVAEKYNDSEGVFSNKWGFVPLESMDIALPFEQIGSSPPCWQLSYSLEEAPTFAQDSQ